MNNLLLVFLAFAAIAAIDLPAMIKSKQWRTLVMYGVIYLLVLTLGVLIASGIKIPSPIKAIQSFYQNVLGLSFKPPP